MLHEETWNNDPQLHGKVGRFIGSLKQCKELQMQVMTASPRGLELELPYSNTIVGNIDSGVIHGGAITTLMDTASGGSVLCCLPELELCPTLDLRVDYMRTAMPGQPIFARAVCYRITTTIIFTRCEAFQRSPLKPIAHCVATFMRIGREASPQWFWDQIEGKADDSPLPQGGEE